MAEPEKKKSGSLSFDELMAKYGQPQGPEQTGTVTQAEPGSAGPSPWLTGAEEFANTISADIPSGIYGTLGARTPEGAVPESATLMQRAKANMAWQREGRQKSVETNPNAAMLSTGLGVVAPMGPFRAAGKAAGQAVVKGPARGLVRRGRQLVDAEGAAKAGMAKKLAAGEAAGTGRVQAAGARIRLQELGDELARVNRSIEEINKGPVLYGARGQKIRPSGLDDLLSRRSELLAEKKSLEKVAPQSQMKAAQASKASAESAASKQRLKEAMPDAQGTVGVPLPGKPGILRESIRALQATGLRGVVKLDEVARFTGNTRLQNMINAFVPQTGGQWAREAGAKALYEALSRQPELQQEIDDYLQEEQYKQLMESSRARRRGMGD